MGNRSTTIREPNGSIFGDEQPGRRLLIKVVEQRARSGYGKPYAYIPHTDNPKDGFREISYQTLLRAIDRCAHLLDQYVGEAGQDHKTVGWISQPSDFRYLIIGFACMKTGHKCFFPSTRNDIQSHLSLLEECRCDFFLQPRTGVMPIVTTLKGKRPMNFVEMPDLEDLLAETADPEPAYAFTSSFEQARFTPCMLLHTSGSTGTPKVVTIKHGWFSAVDGFQNLAQREASPAQFSRFRGLRLFMPFPYFHSASICLSLGLIVFFDMTLICPPTKPLTAELADLYHQHADCDVSILPSSIIHDVASDCYKCENLGKVKYLGYGGSKMSSSLGKPLAEKTHLFSLLGLTEACTLPFQVTAREDWQYLHFEPSTGCRFRERSENEYEMVLAREAETEALQGIFTTFPEVSDWATKDLYSKHPSKPHHWLYEGRADDIIIFSNGEKLNPLTIEQSIEAHPEIRSAIVVGVGRFQPGLLLDARNQDLDIKRQSQLLERVWPTVQEANNNSVAHGRIDKNLIFFTNYNKQLPRTAKGSVRKKLSLELYTQEIDRLYEEFLSAGDCSLRSSLDLFKPKSVLASVRNLVEEQTGWRPSTDEDDLFRSGLDSLQTLNLTRQINSIPGMSAHIDPRDVYSHPTTKSLADLIYEKCGIASASKSTKSRSEQMEEKFQSQAADLPITARPALPALSNTIILTGSTGSLGSYLLDSLLRNRKVAHVYCLNRSCNAAQRQHHSHLERGLTTTCDPKVSFLTCDFSAPYFGLSTSIYRQLLTETTHILHNAWPVNFNLALDSFSETHVRGVRSFIDFCARSAHAAEIYFLSTIGTVQRWDDDQGANGSDANTPKKVPEQIFDSWSVSQSMGYAESKHISERLLQTSSTICSQNTTVCRLGQIAGPVLRGEKGKWGMQEWFPSLIRSSVELGCIPDGLGVMETIDWVPVDVASEVVVGLCLDAEEGGIERKDEGQGARVHHVVNPRGTPWRELLPTVLESFEQWRRPNVVSLREWVDALRRSGKKENVDVEKNPAVKLLPFFEGMVEGAEAGERGVTLSTERTVKRSERLKGLEPVEEEWMRLWMRQWGF